MEGEAAAGGAKCLSTRRDVEKQDVVRLREPGQRLDVFR
jgi:hypothetical protein